MEKVITELKDIKVGKSLLIFDEDCDKEYLVDSEGDKIAKNRFGDIDYTQKYPALRHVTKEEALKILGVETLTDEQVEREHRSRLVGKTLKFGDIPEGCWIDVDGEPMQVIYEENDRYYDGESVKIAYTKCVERRNGRTYYPNSIEYKVIKEPEQTQVLDIRDLAPYEDFVFVDDGYMSEKFQKCFIDENHHVMGILKESGKVAYINHRNAMPNKEVARLVEKGESNNEQ